MEAITMTNMSPHDLKAVVAESVADAISRIKPTSSHDAEISGHVVGRDYLRVNFGLSNYRINQLIRDCRLRPAEIDNGKADYFYLTECLELIKKLNKK